MKRRAFVTLISGIVSWPLAAGAQQASAPAIPTEQMPDPVFSKAMAAVNGKLKDPQSARYDNLVKKIGPNLNGKPAEVVCGSVNLNDLVAGYGKARPFVYFVADGATYLVDANPHPEDVAQIIYGRFCR